MHLRHLFAVAALAAFGQVCVIAQNTPAPAAGGAAPVEATPEMLEVYGWFLGQQMELFSFDFSDEEMAAVSRGLAAAARGEESSADLESVGPALQQFLTARPAEVQQRRMAAGREEQEEFFAKLDANPEVKKTDSGLRYEIVEAGADPKPTSGSTVVAHYTGTFVDGTVFDSSRNRGEPTEFAVNGVIEGWQEGLQLIGTGGRIKLYVPGDLAYGEAGRMNIPPAKALVFDVELIEVRAEQPQLAPLPPGVGPSPAPAPAPGP
jgi:FKBP-type peptidyl-prolyl cis-trans isomerase